MFTSNHSLFFLLTLLIHSAGILVVANLTDQHDETTMAELEISAVELNISDSAKETQPSPPPTPPQEPEPARPEPEPVPDKTPDPKQPPPEITHREPEFKPIIIPEPEATPLLETRQEKQDMKPRIPEPLRIESPRPDPAPLEAVRVEKTEADQPDKSTYSKPLQQKTPPSATPESGAAAARIDSPPKPRRNIKPCYPSGARRRGEEGKVILDVLITPSGQTRSVKIVSSSGHKTLDNAAKKAVRKARFTPGKHKGKKVESQARLTIIFKLK
ncbi:MAG: energy transducer TonB [Kiritimatiellia bacterium]